MKSITIINDFQKLALKNPFLRGSFWEGFYLAVVAMEMISVFWSVAILSARDLAFT